MSTLGKFSDIGLLYSEIVGHALNKETMTRRLREGLFKTFAIVGYPRVINALQQLPPVEGDDTHVLRKEDSWEAILNQRQRGRSLFDAIYERHSARVENQMHAAYPDLAQAAIHHLYGPVLSDTSVISACETSLIVVACLTVMDMPAQLKGHRYGALHLGATQEDLDRAQEIAQTLQTYYSSRDGV